MRVSLVNAVSGVIESVRWIQLVVNMRKVRKSKPTWKTRKEDKGNIIIISVEEESVRSTSETRGQRQGSKHRTSKQVHFRGLPDRYEPLEEDRTSDTAVEEHRENLEKYKRIRKNFGKALRYTWKCLVAGLQSFSTSYSGPLSAASTLVPEIQRTRHKA